MKERRIFVTADDYGRLSRLIEARAFNGWGRDGRLEALEAELDRCEVVPASEIPGDVVTMHATVQLVDLESQQELTYTLVYPHEADIDKGKISVLAPVGTAILGYREGDRIEWTVPGGVRKMRIVRVLSQPVPAPARSVPA